MQNIHTIQDKNLGLLDFWANLVGVAPGAGEIARCGGGVPAPDKS